MMNEKHVRVLIHSKNNSLFSRMVSILSEESIDVIVCDTIDSFKNEIKFDKVYLVVGDCSLESVGECVITSKSNDLFRPIIIFGNDISQCGDDLDLECKKHLIQMGINVFYDYSISDEIIAAQTLNYITLYQAKKDSRSQNDVLRTLSIALEVRDFYTHGHGERVSAYAVILYDELGFKDFEEREALRSAAIIHDVGKLGTPDEILKSNKKLNELEFEAIKKHPHDGVKICQKIVSDPRVIDIIQHHHEKLDGSGYPDKLKGDEISIIVQLTTICDVYDALTSDRSYRAKNTQNEALNIMEEYFVKLGKINKSYYEKFRELMDKGAYSDIKYIG